MDETDWEKIGAIAGIVSALFALVALIISDRLREHCAELRTGLRRWARLLSAKARTFSNRLREPLRRIILAATLLMIVLVCLVFLNPPLFNDPDVVVSALIGLFCLMFIAASVMHQPGPSVFVLFIVAVIVVAGIVFLPSAQLSDVTLTLAWLDFSGLFATINLSDPRALVMAVSLVLSGYVWIAISVVAAFTHQERERTNHRVEIIESLPQLAPALEKREEELLTVVRAEWRDFLHDLGKSRKPYLAHLLKPYEPKQVESYSLHLARVEDKQRPSSSDGLLTTLRRRDFLSAQKDILLAVQGYFGNALLTISWHAVKEERHADLINLRRIAKLPGKPVATLPLPRNSAFADTGRETLFHDAFKTDASWQNYEQGSVARSTNYAHTGSHSLKKQDSDDPHGGFRPLGGSIQAGFVFSGWIYRPAKPWQGFADRLTVENSDFNGYGFAVVHEKNEVWIDRRTNGQPDKLTAESYDAPAERWYYFEFHVKDGGELELHLGDSKAGLQTVATAIDPTYSTFDRVVVRGGTPFHVDELKIQRL